MLAEFLKGIEALTKRANGVEISAVPGDPRKASLRQGETLSMIDLPPPLRKIELRGIDDVLALCRDPAIAVAPEVFHADDAIRVVLDRGDRREFATMALEKSARLLALVRLQKAAEFSVKEAIQFLRVDLHGTGAGVTEVITGLRRIDFVRQSGTARTTEHGRETLGRNVEAAIQQADKVPEDFTVQVPVFMNPGLRGIQIAVRCVVTLDLEREKVILCTLSDEIQSGLNSAQNEIHAKILSSFPTLPVFNGIP